MGITFSVVVPIYNAELYLEECIKSVIQQDYSEFELILVNDGSKDSSLEICKKAAKDDQRIKVIDSENGGQIFARTKGINIAENEYLVFLDADDTLALDALTKLNSIIEKHKVDCVIYGFRHVLNGVETTTVSEVNDLQLTKKKEIFQKILLDSNYNAIWRKSIKREYFESVNLSQYHSIRFGEDLLQTVSLLDQCKKVYFSKEILYNYRVNYAGVTHGRSFLNYSVDYTVENAVLDYGRRNGLFDDGFLVKYRTYCIKRLIDSITMVSLFSATYRQKANILREMHNSSYFGFLCGKYNKKALGKSLIIFLLFKYQIYFCVISCIIMMKTLSYKFAI